MNEEKVTALDIKKALAEKHCQDFFLTEVKNGSTYFPPADGMKILDGLAIKKSYTKPCFTGYEIKVSRSDFLRDAKYHTYATLVNMLYVVCPKGMIDKAELPETVGLMYYDPEKKTITTRKKAIFRHVEYSSDMLLYIIYSRLDSDRVPFYSDRKEYLREYIAGKNDGREIGYRLGTKMAWEITGLKTEIESLQHYKRLRDAYAAVERVMQEHGVIFWSHDPEYTAKNLAAALDRKVPPEVESVRKQLEDCVSMLKKLEGGDEA